jgi:hypothetical protein
MSKKILTGISVIKNGIKNLLLMGVPEIGTKNWNSQPSREQHNEKRKRSMLIVLGKSQGCESVKIALLVAPEWILWYVY